ncbi:hypothetical protein BDK51DRAFT_28438 [Blyttiomyces helicus]|uniref:Uncharacterized protein n=1 Tax=Blyttiomyces helicus TaxID=388810 RepID=A0A4P9WGN7_9FUNG|nr:hypothetical protein BDK51DRAFT_28438 [Blyttiomyces helicus]|eukprot:RKO90993.1 hypothetical protein BDK51DRAFT_28438 [Blyttiomyces helicus]
MDPTLQIADLPRRTPVLFFDLQPKKSSVDKYGRTTHIKSLEKLCLRFGELGLGSDISGVDLSKSRRNGSTMCINLDRYSARRDQHSQSWVDWLPDRIEETCASAGIENICRVSFLGTKNLSADSRFLEKAPSQQPSIKKTDGAPMQVLLRNPEFSKTFLTKHCGPMNSTYGYADLQVDCSTMKPSDVHRMFLSEQGRATMAETSMHPAEFETAMDLGCSFHKSDLLPVLLSRLKRVFPEGTWSANSNDRETGQDCIALKFADDTRSIKIIVRNKFAHTLHAGTGANGLGPAVAEWARSFAHGNIDACLDSGYTCVSILFCCSSLNSVDDYANFSSEIFDAIKTSRKLFKCGIEDQWRSWSEALHSNVAIIDHCTREYLVSMWHDSLTGTISGMKGVLSHSQLRDADWIEDWISAHCLFKGHPIYMVQIEPDSRDPNKGWMSFRAYRKVGNGTYLVGNRQRDMLSAQWVAKRTSGLQHLPALDQVGLTAQANVELRILDDSLGPMTATVPCTSTQIPFRNPLDTPGGDGPYTFYSREFRFRRALLSARSKFARSPKAIETLQKGTRCKVVCWVRLCSCTSPGSGDAARPGEAMRPNTSPVQHREETICLRDSCAEKEGVHVNSIYLIMLSDEEVYAADSTIQEFIQKIEHLHRNAPTGIYHGGVCLPVLFSFEIQPEIAQPIACSIRPSRRANPSLVPSRMRMRVETDSGIESIDCLDEGRKYVVTAIQPYKESRKNRTTQKYLVQIDDKAYRSNSWFEDLMAMPTAVDYATIYDTLYMQRRPFSIETTGQIFHKDTKKKGLAFKEIQIAETLGSSSSLHAAEKLEDAIRAMQYVRRPCLLDPVHNTNPIIPYAGRDLGRKFLHAPADASNALMDDLCSQGALRKSVMLIWRCEPKSPSCLTISRQVLLLGVRGRSHGSINLNIEIWQASDCREGNPILHAAKHEMDGAQWLDPEMQAHTTMSTPQWRPIQDATGTPSFCTPIFEPPSFGESNDLTA